MKRYILALTVIVISLVMNAQDSDILMTLGKNKVTKDDFEYLFLKNRTNVKTKPQTIDEYPVRENPASARDKPTHGRR